MSTGLLAFVREDAYFKVFKAFAAGKHDLTRELLLSRLRKELDITDNSHSKLRQMVMDGKPLHQRDYEALPAQKSARPVKARQARADTRSPEISDDDELDYVPVKATHGRPSELSSRPSRPAKRPKKESTNGLDMKVGGAEGLEINHLIGYKVQRFWPEYGGWWDGVITDYRHGEHCIVYDINTPKESYEWYDISIARNDEFKVSNEKINIIEHAAKSHPTNGPNRNPTNHHAGGNRGGHNANHYQSNQGGGTNGQAVERRVSGNKRNVNMPTTPFVVDSESSTSTSDSDSS